MTSTEAPRSSVSPGAPLGREWSDRLRPVSPALGPARRLSAAPCDRGGGAEASRGSPLAPCENRIGASGRVLYPGLRQGGTGNSSRNSRGFVTSWPRTPPASCSNLGRDDARPLLRRAPPDFGLPIFSEVNPLPWGTPVQGLGFPAGLVPDDGERLYSQPPPPKKK